MATLNRQLPKCGHSKLKSSCRDCAELLSKWNDKLEASGVENIEQPDGNLKQWSSSMARARYRSGYYEAKEEYYRLAGHFLYEYAFENKMEKQVWELHAAGLSIPNITKSLKRKHYRISTTRVGDLIQKLAATMKAQLCSHKS